MNASINIDLDTLNDYAATYGKTYKIFPDPVYTIAVPRLLKLLNVHKIKATFFLVGRDIDVREHFKIIKNIHESGHEIANHTLNHIHNFESLSFEDQEKEILHCHKLVKKTLGLSMVGFRSPGYNLHKGTFKVLSKINYIYDSSLFPTSLLPLLKLTMILKSKGRHKSTGGGNIRTVFGKSLPFYMPDYKILEIPITVTPIFRLPFMGTFNIVTGKKILELSYKQIKFFKTPINYEIHPIEFLDYKQDKLPNLFKNHPGIKISISKKLEIYNTLFSSVKNDYQTYTLANLAKKYL